jgi:hypothetical protein
MVRRILEGTALSVGDPEAEAVAARRDALGTACFVLHLAIMFAIVFGWLAPWKGALTVYVIFLPAVFVQWLLNKNACVLNNFESLIRTGRWRDPGNEEEGAWFLTLARDTLGIQATPAQMDLFIYAVLAVLWSLGLLHAFWISSGHFFP